MKFETENPKLVVLIGIMVAAGLVAVGALAIPSQLAWFSSAAGFALGAVGVQFGKSGQS